MQWRQEQIEQAEALVHEQAAAGDHHARELAGRLARCSTLDAKAAALADLLRTLRYGQQALGRLTDGAERFGGMFLAGLLAEDLAAPFIEWMHGWLWVTYRKAGMPYGETRSGLLRWQREQVHANRSKSGRASRRDRRGERAVADFLHFLETGRHLPPSSPTTVT